MIRAIFDRMMRPCRGISPHRNDRVPAVTEAYVAKSVRNQGPSQIAERPPSPGAIRAGQPPRRD